MPTVYGQDWSSAQSAEPSTSGLGFAFIKATEGRTYTSPDMAAQAAHARAAGLVVGFYHFLHPGNIQAQAEYFVAKCASVDGDLLACDWETTEDGTHATGAEKDAFLAAVRRLRPTHRVLLYCNRSFWTDYDTTSTCGDGLWIADPSSPAGHPAVTHPWTIHQYSEGGGLDRDLANFPTLAALRSWATSTEDDMPTAAEIAEAVWGYQVDDATQAGTQYVTAKAQAWNAAAGAAHSDAATQTLVARVGALTAVVTALSGSGGLTAEQAQAAAEAGARAALAELGKNLQQSGS